ncbi:dihydrodipicolinate synthase family protein [Microbacterium gilvum]|uniref:Dihydrodipicolinate synthase family protein n=1 Tax=Microbacterium gilvum TaxID=1336204 RepID=A0ABP9ABD9_9MICO
MIHGVVPPVVTPLTAQGALDEASLAGVVDEQVAAGASGVFVAGSTGEVALLSDEVRVRALQVAVSAADGRVPVLAGVVDTGTARVVRQAERAEEAGADAVVATPPFYIAPHPAEIARHFRVVAAAVSIPVVAYDIPSATHVPLSASVLRELAGDGAIAGFKDSSGDIAGFRRALGALGDVPALTGSELFADLALELGAAGIVPGLGNVDPQGYVRLSDAVARGDLPAARAEQERLIRLFRIVEVADRGRIGATAAALGSFKAAMWLRGAIDSPRTSEPLGALLPSEIDAVGAILEAERLL